MYSTDTPIIPSPTTLIPITEPPEKATFNALFIPFSIAALAVLTLALVATFIPKYPARAENTAPTKKDTAVCQFMPIISTIKRTTTNIDNALYSLFKKAMAPSSI